MGDMGDLWKDAKADYKKRCANRNSKYEPILIKLGAVEKSTSVYELDGWFLYPTKGFAMNKYNPNQRMSLDKFIKQKECNNERISKNRNSI